MGILNYLQIHFPTVLHYKYVFLFLASSLEGFNSMILAGFLISAGVLAFLPAFIIGVFGEVINSYFWYGIGYWMGARPIDFFVRKSRTKRRIVEKIRSYLEQYTGLILLLMKITFSLTIVTLIMTGSIKYNLKKFSLYNLIGSVGWITITFGLGYFFGKGYQLYIRQLQNLSYVVIFVLAVVIFVFALESISNALFVQAINVVDRLGEVGEKVKEGLDKFLGEDDK